MSEAQEELTIEEALSAAFEELENDEEETVEEVVDEVEEEVEEVDDEEEIVDEVAETAEISEVEDEVAEDDEETEEDDEPPPLAAQTEEPESGPPQSWRPTAREGWNDIPPEAREEILRREQDIEKKLGELSNKSAQSNAFEAAVEPFRQTIAIEAGGDPIAATRNLMTVATRLRMGTPQEKAMVVRDIINQYGVDVGTLDEYLSSGPPPASQQSYQQPYPQAMPVSDPRVDQMWNAMSAQNEQAQQSAAQEVENFINGKEWGNDVRNDMADVMDLAARRGERLTLDEAYDRAVMLRPDLQQIIAQRQAVQEKPKEQESLKRKKRRARQISGSPAGGPTAPDGQDLRATLAAAFDDQGG